MLAVRRSCSSWAALCTLFALIALLHQQTADSEVLRMPHPDDAAKQVEYFLEAPAGNGPWPTIILLHGHQEGARPGGKDFIQWGVLKQLASRGYLAVAVSQPGFGNSTGPSDFCGPFTQHAVSGVIAKLRAEGRASPHRLVIEGISAGAITAGLVAAKDPSVSGLVLISGVYDLSAYAAESNANPQRQAIVAGLLAETGGTPEALNARSLLRLASSIKASSLILNGAKDDRTDPRQARTFAKEVLRSGGIAKVIIYPDYGHYIPVEVRNKDIDPFIDNLLRGREP